jgi:hypothetical protein
MTVLSDPPARVPLDEEALFREAKQRERRRRLFMVGLALIVGAAGLSVGLLASGIIGKAPAPLGQQASGSAPATLATSNPSCRTSSPSFEKALASAIRELRPRVRGAVQYVCATSPRNLALRVEDSGQMGAALGAQHVVAVALMLQAVVSDEGYTGPPGSRAPQGNYVTFNFNAATGAPTDFGLRLISAKHPASDFGHLGATTTGTVVFH